MGIFVGISISTAALPAPASDLAAASSQPFVTDPDLDRGVYYAPLNSCLLRAIRLLIFLPLAHLASRFRGFRRLESFFSPIMIKRIFGI